MKLNTNFETRQLFVTMATLRNSINFTICIVPSDIFLSFVSEIHNQK